MTEGKEVRNYSNEQVLRNCQTGSRATLGEGTTKCSILPLHNGEEAEDVGAKSDDVTTILLGLTQELCDVYVEIQSLRGLIPSETLARRNGISEEVMRTLGVAPRVENFR